jgi:hypothetical protein
VEGGGGYPSVPMSGKQFGIRLANRRLLALVMIFVNP